MPLTTSTVDALAAIVGPDALLTEAEDLIPYSFDGTAALKQRPEAVVFPRTTAQVAEVVRLAGAARVPIVTRGSGTGLSGGSVPTPGSLVLCLVPGARCLVLGARCLVPGARSLVPGARAACQTCSAGALARASLAPSLKAPQRGISKQ